MSSDLGDTLFGATFELPRLVLKQSALQKNIDTMNRFCDEAGVLLAPHAKTTMAPVVLRAQLQSGVWGMTVATMSQLRVCIELGADRVIVANEIVNGNAAASLGDLLETNPKREIYTLVDSTECVALLAAGLRRSGLSRRFPVLLEVGIPGYRTGCRTREEALRIAEAVRAQGNLVLSGVEGFEGLIGIDRSTEQLERVDEYLGRSVAFAAELAGEGFFDGREEVILTAGGSDYFDRVVAVLKGAELGMASRVILQSGAYATWDHHRHDDPPPGVVDAAALFDPAIELWAEVLSVPEDGLAVAGFGKREASYDSGLPIVLARVREGGADLQRISGVTVRRLNDHHAILDVADGTELGVGDRLVCGLIHPCTVFDKWRHFAVVDDDYRVLSLAETLF